MSCCGNNLLGGNNKVIKYYGSDLIAVDGSNTVARSLLVIYEYRISSNK